jgi:hypothetical protein
MFEDADETSLVNCSTLAVFRTKPQIKSSIAKECQDWAGDQVSPDANVHNELEEPGLEVPECSGFCEDPKRSSLIPVKVLRVNLPFRHVLTLTSSPPSSPKSEAVHFY